MDTSIAKCTRISIESPSLSATIEGLDVAFPWTERLWFLLISGGTLWLFILTWLILK